MKIALVMYELNAEFGGILNFLVHLAKGLENNGHKVGVFMVRPTSKSKFRTRDTGGRSGVLDSGYGLQIRVHSSGDSGKLIGSDEITRLCVGAGAEELRDELSEYDGVIVIWPPSYGDGNFGQKRYWMRALEHDKPQIVIAHDCHWQKIYPWILAIKDRIDCLVGVHPAAYDSIKNWPGKICNIFNAFDISDADRDYSDKDMNKVCNTAFFKRWKHNDDGIRAAPYLDPVHIYYTGGGIESAYAQSNFTDAYHLDRIKRWYWKEGDRSVRSKWIGRKIWDVAKKSGNFHFLGIVSNHRVKELQRECGGLTEFAYHPKWGEHWNRALIEGMIRHCVPFARPTGALGGLVKKENVVLIPEDASPRRIAEIIKSAMRDSRLVKEVVQRNLGLLKHFDRNRLARQYVRLLTGEDPRCWQGPEYGEPDAKVNEFLVKFCAKRFPRTWRFPR